VEYLLWTLASFSLDVDGLLTSAEDIFNGLFPVFAIAIGITIGLGLIALVAREIRKSF
jgi:ABC-type nickel/cobalt efflux system permease component RcnA